MSPVIAPTFSPTQPTMDPTQRAAETVYAETLIERHQSLILNIFAIFMCFCCFALAIYFYSKRQKRAQLATDDKTETDQQEMTLINIARALSFHQETANETLGDTMDGTIHDENDDATSTNKRRKTKGKQEKRRRKRKKSSKS